MKELYDRLTKNKGISNGLLTLLIISSLLAFAKAIAESTTTFQTPGVLWGLGAALTLAITVTAISVLGGNKALYSTRQRLLSVAILGLMFLFGLHLTWSAIIDARPIFQQWRDIFTWLNIIGSIGTIFALGLCWLLERKRGNTFRVLVTEFSEGANEEKPEDRTIKVLVQTELEKMAQSKNDLEIVYLDKVVLKPTEARKFGQNIQATVVLFGFYSKTKLKVLLEVNFEVLKQPDHYYPLSIQQRKVDIEDFNSFSLHTDLANEAVALTSFLLGLFKYSRKNLDEAIQDFERALDRLTQAPDKQIAVLNTYLGNSLYYLGQTNQAIEKYSVARDMVPKYAKAWHNLGAAYTRLGKIKEAIDLFTKAINTLEIKSSRNCALVPSD
jgi:tetratricopeptide (TPR) repeat protein/uncharacterized membrane protein